MIPDRLDMLRETASAPAAPPMEEPAGLASLNSPAPMPPASLPTGQMETLSGLEDIIEPEGVMSEEPEVDSGDGASMIAMAAVNATGSTDAAINALQEAINVLESQRAEEEEMPEDSGRLEDLLMGMT